MNKIFCLIAGLVLIACGGDKNEEATRAGEEPPAVAQEAEATKTEEEQPAANQEAPQGDCNAACENMIHISMGEAMKSMPALPPQMKARMETQMAAAKARAKEACLASCRPEIAGCLTKAKDFAEISTCQINAARGGAPAPAATATAPEAVEAAPAVAAAPAAESDGFSVGSRVSCNWKDYGTYYNGRVTRKSGNSVHVKYDDGDEEDTSISMCRPVAGGGDAVAAAPAAEPAGATNLSVNQKVEVLWNGSWYAATVLAVHGNGKTRVHYKGWDSSWDEDVSNDRIRNPQQASAEDEDDDSDEDESADDEEIDEEPSEAMVRVNIKVKLKRTKSDGSNWDAFGGEPDIAICVDSESGIKCYPDGDSVSGIIEPECQDSFRCTFRNIAVPAGEFELTVVDVDAMSNDTAGSEDCKPRGSCTVGRAKVQIKPR